MKRKFLALFAGLFTCLFLFSACAPEGGGGGGGTGGGGGSVDGSENAKDVTVNLYYGELKDFGHSDAWLWDEMGSIRSGGYLWEEGNFGTYGKANTKYNAKVSVKLSTAVGRLGFLIRLNCTDPGGESWGTATKDGTGNDRFIPLDERFINDKDEIDAYVHAGNADIFVKDSTGEESVMKLFDMANLVNLKQISCLLTPSSVDVGALHAKVTDEEGNVVPYKRALGTVLHFDNELDLNKSYTVTIDGYGSAPVVPYSYFSTTGFTQNYTYEGDDLGVTFQDGVPSFRLWAPTASKVVLNIYDAGSGGEPSKRFDLTSDVKGTWVYKGTADLMKKYYTYSVTTSAGTQEAVDPYAVSGGVNGDRGMILDISSAETFPQGWDGEVFTPTMANGEPVVNYTDANIWEIHVKDFSNKITNSQYKGKFLAFTEKGLTENGVPVGIDYLKNLGITHVHVQPAFDYSSVDETKGTGFNWGYDPKNYNMPEGSYSTDPNDGIKRVQEFRAMVQALHDAGIGVIMDVVYNHTSGLSTNFQKIVPYYYYRFSTSTGKPSNGSGCGNETASDRSMYRKFMIESVMHWLKDYNLDGFRFDLMKLHDVETMKQIETKVHEVNERALIYGEGWDGGGNGLALEADKAGLANLQALNSHPNGIAMFNDTTRNGLKGGTDDASKGFATGGGSGNRDKILFGFYGGTSYKDYWSSANPTQVINYASCHDNLALFDKIQLATSNKTTQYQYNRLVATVIQTSLGVPFMLAGEEMCRSKPNDKAALGFDPNSYNASDEVNNIRWNNLTPNSEEYKMMQYYTGLIAFRAAHPVLRSTTATVIKAVGGSGSVITVHFSNGTDDVFVVINAGTASATVTLPSGTAWFNYVNGSTGVSGTTKLGAALSGQQTIPALSAFVYAK